MEKSVGLIDKQLKMASKIARVERLIQRINEEVDRTENVVFWYGSTPELRVRKAEELIGNQFPESYRHFLRMVGGGGIESFSILGVPRKGNIRHSGSVLGYSDHWRRDAVSHKLPNHLVVIEHSEDGDEPFCLELSRMRRRECPVVLWYPWNSGVEDIAPSFIDFWERYSEPYFD